MAAVAGAAVGSCTPGDNPGGGDRSDTGTWEFTREVRGDTTFVHTISGSVWGPLPPLEPDLVIGMADGPEEYLFGMITHRSVSPDGRIWIWDLQFEELRAYYPDGTFDRIITRRGEGPNEVRSSNPSVMIPLPDGRLRVVDRSALAVIDFDQEGAVVNRYRWPALLYGEGTTNLGAWNAGNDGTMYRMISEIQPPSPGHSPEQPLHLEAHRPEEGRVDTIPLPPSPPVRINPDREAGGGGPGRLDFWQAGPDGTIIRADAERYVIDVFHPDGRRISISRDWVPQPYTAAQRARAEERGSPVQSEYRPAFRAIDVGLLGDVIFVTRHTLFDELADSFVRELRETDPLGREWEFGTTFTICDIFRLDGTYLGAVISYYEEDGRSGGGCGPQSPLYDGKVWAPGRGDGGIPQFHRYSVGPG